MKNKLIDFGLLWLRVMLGLGAMYHAWGKITGDGGIPGWADRLVAPMGFPVPILFGFIAVGCELFGGFFVLLGLWTRYAAAAAVCVWLTAFFVHHQADPLHVKELVLAYALTGITIVITGPGAYAVHGSKGGGRPAPTKKGK